MHSLRDSRIWTLHLVSSSACARGSMVAVPRPATVQRRYRSRLGEAGVWHQVGQPVAADCSKASIRPCRPFRLGQGGQRTSVRFEFQDGDAIAFKRYVRPVDTGEAREAWAVFFEHKQTHRICHARGESCRRIAVVAPDPVEIDLCSQVKCKELALARSENVVSIEDGDRLCDDDGRRSNVVGTVVPCAR